LNRAPKGFEDVEALDVTRDLLDEMRAQAGTDNMVRINTSALKGMLLWGYQTRAKYFTAEQSELLISGGSRPSPKNAPATRRPRRNTRPRNAGESEQYIRTEDAPGSALVAGLGRELDKRYPLWGTLAAECAANLGFRWGEEFQLAAADVHMQGCREEDEAHVHVDWQINSGAKAGPRRSRLTLPKGNKRRIVTITDISFTGYEFEAALAARVAAALREQEAGLNDDALLFLSQTGRMLWHTTFTRHVHVAMRAAGWPYTEWVDEKDGKTKTVYHLTWHSMRHRYARICIDDFDYDEGELMMAGGWDNELTVKNRYYRSSDENRKSAAAKSRRRK
jgi:integrase